MTEAVASGACAKRFPSDLIEDRDAQAAHPGEILREEFLVPLGLSPGPLARRPGVPRKRDGRLAAGQTAISPDSAFRLACYCNTTPEFWMNLQTAHDLAKACRGLDLSAVPRHAA